MLMSLLIWIFLLICFWIGEQEFKRNKKTNTKINLLIITKLHYFYINSENIIICQNYVDKNTLKLKFVDVGFDDILTPEEWEDGLKQIT